MIRTIAIVGGGFSGSLLAINLMLEDGPQVLLVERASLAGRGLAFATPHDCHLLNVRAANMSAFPDRPGHFVQWLQAAAPGAPADFVPRALFGRYVQEMLDGAIAANPGRLRVLRDEAVAVERGEGFRLQLASGETIAADAMVLALGNLPPHPPAGIDPARLPPGLYVEDPWRTDVAAGLGPDATVLLVGTGLTAIDIAVLLSEQGFGGRIIAFSRRGLLPRAHADGPAPPPALERPPAPSVRGIVRQLRRDSMAMDWRHAVDRLRPHTQAIWARMPEAERRRFLRHARPWWDVHRHRLAPAVAAEVARLMAGGQLQLLAARVQAAAPADDRTLAVRLALKGGDLREVRAARIVNCTGPTGDLARSREPLLKDMLARGLARPDALALGLDVDHLGRVRDAVGRVDPRLWAVGPISRAGAWEITAVPDIRNQVAALARRLSGSHWVGGEGL